MVKIHDKPHLNTVAVNDLLLILDSNDIGGDGNDPIVKNITVQQLLDMVSGAGSIYSNSIPTSVPIGGIETGTTFTNQTMQEMWDALLYPYQVPSFTSFNFQGWSTSLEVGQSTNPNPVAQWNISNPYNLKDYSPSNPGNITISDVTGPNLSVENLLDNEDPMVVSYHPLTYSSITKNSADIGGSTSIYHRFNISAMDSNDNTLSRNYNIYWYWKIYWGSDDGTTPPALFNSLSDEVLASSPSRDYLFSANPNTYKYILIPSNMTPLTFTDTLTGFNVPFDIPVSFTMLNENGESRSYNRYKSTNMIGAEITIRVGV